MPLSYICYILESTWLCLLGWDGS